MNALKLTLFVLLGSIGCAFTAFWTKHLRAHNQETSQGKASRGVHLALGFVTDFLDTLGIGSFAVTAAAFRFWRIVPDRLIPGTLNVGHALPTIAEAFIFIALVEVEPLTLAVMIVASIVGAWLGAGVVSRWSKRKVQLGMGTALLCAAVLMLAGLLHVGPEGGTLLGLSGLKLIIGAFGNFVLGMFMTIGIGLFAPCMILVYFLGMNPKVAFPIMMGSCAFLMPIASIRFIRFQSYEPKAALGLALGGVPAVLIAAYLVGSLPLEAVRWLVLFVVVYTSIGLLRSARNEVEVN